MTDEQRLQMITEQLILVRDNLFRGMSKSIQKLQARSINELLELPSHTQSPPAQRTWVNATTWRGLTDDEIYSVLENLQVMHHRPPTTDSRVIFALAIEAKLKEKNQ